MNNPHVYGMYLLHKGEMLNSGIVNEKLLYHCTSTKNAVKIASNNIDWRWINCTHFGKGACFLDEPMYAFKYAGSHGGKTNDLIFFYY